MKKFLLLVLLLCSFALTGCEGMDLDLGDLEGQFPGGETGGTEEGQDNPAYEKDRQVFFDSKGGTAVKHMKLSEIMKEGVPTPTKEGYYFDGWYLEGEKVDFTKINPSKKITVEAKWISEEEYYSINHKIEKETELNVLQIASVLNGVVESLKTDNFQIKAESYGLQTGSLELTVMGNSEEEYQGFLKTKVAASEMLGTPEMNVEAYLKDGYVYATIDTGEVSKVKIEISEYLEGAADAKATLIDSAGLSLLEDVIELSAYEPASIGIDKYGNVIIEVNSQDLATDFRVIVKNNKIAYFEYYTEGLGQKVYIKTENVNVDFSGLVPEEYTEQELQ